VRDFGPGRENGKPPTFPVFHNLNKKRKGENEWNCCLQNQRMWEDSPIPQLTNKYIIINNHAGEAKGPNQRIMNSRKQRKPLENSEEKGMHLALLHQPALEEGIDTFVWWHTLRSLQAWLSVLSAVRPRALAHFLSFFWLPSKVSSLNFLTELTDSFLRISHVLALSHCLSLQCSMSLTKSFSVFLTPYSKSWFCF